MSTDEINRWLTEAIAAARAGKRAEARELLLRVVDADENNVQAWLWLSSVVTTLEDREVCLENVLALDPENEAVRLGLATVRAEIAATPEIEPESALPSVEAQAAPETKVAFDFSDTELDDPLLCVYCAHQTREEDAVPSLQRDLTPHLRRDKPR
jgi:hypothetical protein